MEPTIADDAPASTQTPDSDTPNNRLVVDLLHVREVLDLDQIDIVKIPDAHSYASGTGMLHGKEIPIVDLGLRLQSAFGNPKPRLVVLKLEGHIMGFVVDDVSDVLLRGGEDANALENYVAAVITVDPQISNALDLPAPPTDPN